MYVRTRRYELMALLLREEAMVWITLPTAVAPLLRALGFFFDSRPLMMSSIDEAVTNVVGWITRAWAEERVTIRRDAVGKART